MPREGRGPLPYELTGTSTLVRDCLGALERAAADERHVLIVAERGLDAPAIARTLHARAPRGHGRFITIPPSGSAIDIERSLFGTARPTVKGATIDQISSTCALARARGGVLFVPELGELPAPVQRRLALVLRDGEVRLPRRRDAVELNCRTVASVERRLDEGLLDELARRFPHVVEIPPLRQRREDVPHIARAMLEARGLTRQFTPAALTVLAALPWRRNTAELAGLIARLTALSSTSPIRQEDVLAEVQLDLVPARASGSLRDARRQFEREYIASVLRDHEWQIRDAARALGIERANLYRKARQLGIPLGRAGAASYSGQAR